MHPLKKKIFQLALKNKAKVGVGLLRVNKSILASLIRASKYAEITVIGTDIKGFNHIPATQENIEEKEVEALMFGKIDGLIRGQADTYKFEDTFARKAGYARSQILGGNLFEDQFGRMFFTTSGSHSDGWTAKSKIMMIDEILKKIKGFGIKPKIGFLTWVRPGSVGRNFFFDQTWEQAEYLVNYYQKKGYQAKNYNIEIENALKDSANLIVFANGTSGNMLSRVFMYLTKDPFYLLFHTGIKEVIMENSRNIQDYFNLIVGAVAFVNQKKK